MNFCALVTACPSSLIFHLADTALILAWRFTYSLQVSPLCLHCSLLQTAQQPLLNHAAHAGISCLAWPFFSGQGLLQAPTARGTDLCHNTHQPELKCWFSHLSAWSATELLEGKEAILFLKRLSKCKDEWRPCPGYQAGFYSCWPGEHNKFGQGCVVIRGCRGTTAQAGPELINQTLLGRCSLETVLRTANILSTLQPSLIFWWQTQMGTALQTVTAPFTFPWASS